MQKMIEVLISKYHREFDDVLPWEKHVFFKGFTSGRDELV
jgi:hypothetical protein